tara:strand:- start:319 stop:564 length:246 start_codon:yes stop_codon:yes gene_type:complete
MDMETLIKHLEVDDWRKIFLLLKEHTVLFDEIQQEANGFVAEHKAILDRGNVAKLPTEYYHAERLILILSYFNIINKDEFS